MKTKRVINIAFWVALCICLSVLVSIHWANQACPVPNIIVGVVVYAVLCGLFCLFVDLNIR